MYAKRLLFIKQKPFLFFYIEIFIPPSAGRYKIFIEAYRDAFLLTALFAENQFFARH
jgi:hypothetical protein